MSLSPSRGVEVEPLAAIGPQSTRDLDVSTTETPNRWTQVGLGTIGDDTT